MYGLISATQRAVLIGDYKAKRDQGIWFDPDAFARPQDVTWGLGRNSFSLPGVNNWDVVIQKFFPLDLGEESKLNFRMEMYNFFNHTQVWTVGTGFSATIRAAESRRTTGARSGNRMPSAIRGPCSLV